jgi:hypothetical protein
MVNFVHSVNFGSQNRFACYPVISSHVAKCFGTFIRILTLSALSFCLPLMAQEQNGWQFDSQHANSSVFKPDVQQVYEILLKMLDRWNAHDIEATLSLRRALCRAARTKGAPLGRLTPQLGGYTEACTIVVSMELSE